MQDSKLQAVASYNKCRVYAGNAR